MFHESELINLTFGVVGLFILFRFFRDIRFPGVTYFKYGFVFIVCSYVCTVAEGIMFPGFFDLLEHTGYALSGIMFAMGCWDIKNSSPAAHDRMQNHT